MKSFERPLRDLVPALVGTLAALTAFAAPKRANIDEAFYRTHVARLASDDFGGRKPGTSAEKLTLDYLVGEFRKLGLKPGNGTSFLQEVPIVEITAVSDAGLRFATGGIRKGAAGYDITFLHPKSNDEFPIAGEGVLIELVQAPADVIAALG